MISSESWELLQDFEKRMRFVNLVKYLINRSTHNDIQEIFGNNENRIDNLVLMVLVFIMDSTLRYGERCTKQDIIVFLRELSDIYGYLPEYAEKLADYIVTDVLQSGGKIRLFDTFQSNERQFREQSTLILIEHQGGNYVLTNEAYEFLFRTKEIDSELDFSVSRFKLQEFIRRGNYSKALRESRELVSRVRNLKTRMDDFMLRCRTSISDVSVEEYEEIVTQVKYSFEDESKQLSDIRTLVSAKLQAIADIDISDSGNIRQTEREISEILENIDTVINEQSRVYNQKFTLSDLYAQLLDDSFSYLHSGHIDFEQELLSLLRKLSAYNAKDIGRLFQPLYIPAFLHIFSLDYFYGRQNAVRECAGDNGIDIGIEENIETTADIRNKRYVNIIKSLFLYADSCTDFRFSDYLKTLTDEMLELQLQENALPDVMLKLYAIGEINIAAWREEQHSIIIPVGEFDLSYCLSELPKELVQMQLVIIRSTEDMVMFPSIGNRQIKMNDLTVEVVK
ncbi:MAG: hypothetical protein J1F28_02905 [Oscillospiraceae bacterium]|nr:hypothetical protein [Oscillospiraceae bacterium]